jgi:hypothetical protein
MFRKLIGAWDVISELVRILAGGEPEESRHGDRFGAGAAAP